MVLCTVNHICFSIHIVLQSRKHLFERQRLEKKVDTKHNWKTSQCLLLCLPWHKNIFEHRVIRTESSMKALGYSGDNSTVCFAMFALVLPCLY